MSIWQRLRIKWRQFWCWHDVYCVHTLQICQCDRCSKQWKPDSLPDRYIKRNNEAAINQLRKRK